MPRASDGHICVQTEEVDIFWSEPLANGIQEILQENIGFVHQLQDSHEILHHMNFLWHLELTCVSPLIQASFDQFVPDASSLKDVLSHHMNLGKVPGGLEVKVRQKRLNQLRSFPELPTGMIPAHFVTTGKPVSAKC